MVTRVRIEAEGSTPSEVEQILYAAHEALTQRSSITWTGADGVQLQASATTVSPGLDVAFGSQREALADAQCGELVIERFAKDLKGEPGHGAIFFRGRMTTHYAAATPTLDLRKRQPGAESAPYSEV